MKPLALFSLATLVLPCMAAPTWGQEWARRLNVEAVTEFDFGQIDIGGSDDRILRLTNPYRRAVHIKLFSYPGDSLQQVTADRETLGPGESCEITLVPNTNRRPGPIEGELQIHFDAPFRGELHFPLRGEVLGDYYLEPARIDFGQVTHGRRIAKEIEIHCYGNHRWDFDEIQSSSEHLEPSLSDPRYDRKTRYTLTVLLSAEAPLGAFEEQIVLASADENDPPITIEVVGEVRELLTTDRPNLQLNHVGPGEVVTRHFGVRGSAPFRVLRVEADDPRLSVTFQENEREINQITVTFTAGEEPGPFRSEFTVFTDLDELSITLSVEGEIVQREEAPPPE